MWVIALAGVGLLGLMTLLGSHETFQMIAGKKYRIFWRVTPGLNIDMLNSFVTSLTAMGFLDIDTTQGDNETVGTFTVVATTNKQVILGKPILAVQNGISVEVIVTRVEEIP